MFCVLFTILGFSLSQGTRRYFLNYTQDGLKAILDDAYSAEKSN